MKRRRLMITGVLLLLLGGGGAIVNVAVAWGCALALDVARQGSRTTSERTEDGINHQIERRTQPGAELCRSVWIQDYLGLNKSSVDWSGLPRWMRHRRPIDLEETYRIDRVWNHQLWGHAFGWPFVSLYWSYRWDSRIRQWDVDDGIDLIRWPHIRDNGMSWPRVLPLAIVWPGFAINTIFYAAILWVVFCVPGMVRRRIRRRRGLCPACAYPVGTSEVCTECGKALLKVVGTTDERE